MSTAPIITTPLAPVLPVKPVVALPAELPREAAQGLRPAEQRREARRSLGMRPVADLVIHPVAEPGPAGLDPAQWARSGPAIKVQALRDISSSGLAVYVDQALEPGQTVAIELRGGSLQLAFSGLVAWCALAENLGDEADRVPAPHVMGLALTSQQALASMLGL
jgi:hypothetical protein